MLGQLDAGRALVSLAKGRSPFDEKYKDCMRSVKRILAFTDAKLWTLHLEPEDILRVSAESELLVFEIDAMCRR
jgi:hypothetical protein